MFDENERSVGIKESIPFHLKTGIENLMERHSSVNKFPLFICNSIIIHTPTWFRWLHWSSIHSFRRTEYPGTITVHY